MLSLLQCISLLLSARIHPSDIKSVVSPTMLPSTILSNPSLSISPILETVSIPLASKTLVLFPAVTAVESITSQLESKPFISPRTSKKCQRNASPAEPRPKPPLLILPARVGIPLLRLLLVVGVVVLMVLLLPLRSMPRISGPVRAGLGLPNLVISRREHPRRQ